MQCKSSLLTSDRILPFPSLPSFLSHPRHLSPTLFSDNSQGVATYSNNVTVGGLAVVDIETMVSYSEVPLTMVSDLGTPITQNPFDVALVDGKMRLYFLPDQRNSTLYVYEAEQNSPYQY